MMGSLTGLLRRRVLVAHGCERHHHIGQKQEKGEPSCSRPDRWPYWPRPGDPWRPRTDEAASSFGRVPAGVVRTISVEAGGRTRVLYTIESASGQSPTLALRGLVRALGRGGFADHEAVCEPSVLVDEGWDDQRRRAAGIRSHKAVTARGIFDARNYSRCAARAISSKRAPPSATQRAFANSLRSVASAMPRS